MTRAQSGKVDQVEATRHLLDEMAFAVAALGALVTAARGSGTNLVAEGERMEDLANRLLDLSETIVTPPEPETAYRRAANSDLQ